jgi:signal transduction histidine kinase
VHRLRHALWPAGLALGVAAEWSAYDGDAALTAADATVGAALIGAGLLVWGRRPRNGVGPIMTAAGFLWFVGTFGGWALYLHRGALAHLVLSYPSGHARSRLERGSIAGAYAYAVVYPIAASDYATIGFAVALVAVSGRRYAVAGGPERWARLSAFGAAVAFGSLLVLGAVTQLANADVDRTVLWAYDAVVLLVALGLAADLLCGRWSEAAVTGLVVDLGEPGSAGTLRERLARALGDPTLEVGYFLAEQDRYVDEAGQPFKLPVADATRAVTPISEGEKPVAALVHDAAVLDDQALVSAVASAARLAVSNARLQADVRARVAAVHASRRRIVQAADAQRRQLERELRDGAERRLAHMAELLDACGPEFDDVRRDLDAARSDVREFARGIHPAVLTDSGLAPALGELAARSPVPATVEAPPGRWPPAIEAALYFVCSEALTNIAKYARASRASVVVDQRGDHLRVAVADDGVGGADPSTGSGLRGLADRVEALGGRLEVASRPGHGTRVLAEIVLR